MGDQKPTQHLSLTRLTFETDCKECYAFWLNYFIGGHHKHRHEAPKIHDIPEPTHYGQHVFAVEMRERVEF